MAHFPEAFLQEIRDRIDLLDLVSARVALKKSGANWSGLCPFHDEKTPSFSVHPGKGIYKCFGCGAGGDAFSFLMKTRGLSFPEAVEELAARAGLSMPSQHRETPEQRQRRQQYNRLREVLEEAQKHFYEQLQAPVGKGARRYLQGRGFSPQDYQRYGFGFAPPGWNDWYDRFRERITFAIRDARGRLTGFGGRILGDGKPKYINSPETPLYQKGRLLYGFDLAQDAIQKRSEALVVEGYMDRLALSVHGVEHAVATLGTALTEEHLQLLWRRTRRITFCFDGDRAGRKAAWRAAELGLHGLEADRHLHFLFLPDGEDPDDVVHREGHEGFLRRVKQATPLASFLFQHLSEDLETGSPEGRAALIHRARPYFEGIADPVLRRLYVETFSQRLGIPQEQVQGLVQGGTVRNVSPPPPMAVPQRPWQPPPERGPEGVALAHGRDYEQVMLALLLRYGRLLLEHEEELGALDFSSLERAQLMTALLGLTARLDQDGKPAPYTLLTDPALQHLAGMLLKAESRPDEAFAGSIDSAEQEFIGCLATCQLRRIEREIERIEQRGREASDAFSRENWETLKGLKTEMERLRRLRMVRSI